MDLIIKKKTGIGNKNENKGVVVGESKHFSSKNYRHKKIASNVK